MSATPIIVTPWGAALWHTQPTSGPWPVQSYRLEPATRSHLAQYALHDTCQHRVFRFSGYNGHVLEKRLPYSLDAHTMIYWDDVLSAFKDDLPKGTRLMSHPSRLQVYLRCWICHKSAILGMTYNLHQPEPARP